MPLRFIRNDRKPKAESTEDDTKSTSNDDLLEAAVGQKRKREEEKDKNVLEFFVGYDHYYTEDESTIPSAEDWWRGASFRPGDVTQCLSMKVDEALLWRCLNAGCSVLVSGKAGSGKSHLLQRFIASCDNSLFTTVLTAPTGIAAFNVGGETLHRRLGLGLASDDPVSLFQMISRNRRKFAKTWKFLAGTDILIIDEISMVHPDFMMKLDYLFRKAKDSAEPFGGVRLVMVGDFTQLGPIVKKDEDCQSRLVLDTEVWERMKLARIFLVRSYRQAEGDPFLDLLNEVREGKLSESSRSLLTSRIDADVGITGKADDESELKIQPIDIFPYRYMVDRCNKLHLDLLIENGAEVKTFYPAMRIAKREHAKNLDMNEYDKAQNMLKKENVKQIQDKFPLYFLKLAVGAQVMMRCNTYIDQGIYNGSLGIVTAIEANYISVRFVVNGKFMDTPIDVARCDFSSRVGKTVEVIMTQYPLTLAYATTIHKTLRGDSVLFTEHGLIPIEQVTKKDGWEEKEFKLHTYAPTMETTSHVYRGEVEPTIKLTTKMGFTIEGSLEHPMMVRTKEGKEVWRLLNCMQHGDVLVGKHSQKAGSKTYLWHDSKLVNEDTANFYAGCMWKDDIEYSVLCTISKSPSSVQVAFISSLFGDNEIIGLKKTIPENIVRLIHLLLLNNGYISSLSRHNEQWCISIDNLPSEEEEKNDYKFYDPVVSIESGKCQLYDLTVPGTHSFIANGLVSSNCQGLTLDSVRIDASNCFETGQLYVALSRVRKLEHLSLIDFDEKSLLADARAVEYEHVHPSKKRKIEEKATN